MSDTDAPPTPDTTSDDTGKDDWATLTAALKEDGMEPGQVAELLKASRRWEARAKENAKAVAELEELKRSSMSETDKAVEEAKVAARNEVMGEVAVKMAAVEIKAALTGVVPNPDSIIEDLNLSRYVTEDGDVDAKAVKALATKYQELAPATGNTDLKQGNRGNPPNGGTDGNAWMRSL